MFHRYNARHVAARVRALSIRARIAVFAVIAAPFVLFIVPSASASGYGWDYISLPTWLGNCPGGGSVKYLDVMIGNTWSGGDAGDDLVYGKVILGQNQEVVAEGICYNGKKSYMGPAVSQTIHPTRSGQTWWIGPQGVTHN